MKGLVGAESIPDEKYESSGWRFGALIPLDTKGVHTMNDWTDKIDVKDGNNVHRMENDGDTKEAKPSKARHLVKRNVEVVV